MYIFLLQRKLIIPGKQNCVTVLEGNKQILAIAVRHTSFYENKNAFEFLWDLIKVSEKYARNRPMIEAALNTIRPPGAQPQQTIQPTQAPGTKQSLRKK